MAKRGDNIRKRKDGRWEGRYKKDALWMAVLSTVQYTGKPIRK